MTDKELWYPEAEHHGYYLEGDKIVARYVGVRIDSDIILDLIKSKLGLPKDASFCASDAWFYSPDDATADGFIFFLRSKEFDQVRELGNAKLTRITKWRITDGNKVEKSENKPAKKKAEKK